MASPTIDINACACEVAVPMHAPGMISMERNHSMSYALYKFHRAILSLRDADLSRRQWLASSYIQHILHLCDDDLPAPVRPSFRQLRDALTRATLTNPSGSPSDALHRLDSMELDGLIKRVEIMYEMIMCHESTLNPH